MGGAAPPGSSLLTIPRNASSARLADDDHNVASPDVHRVKYYVVPK
jgi:hypothetical protein